MSARRRACVLVAALPLSAAYAANGAACSSGDIPLGRLGLLDAPSTSLPEGGATDSAADAASDAASCIPPEPRRHYDFAGTGTEVVDRRGGPSGRVLGGATLDGSGVLRLDGVDDYVDLPNGLVSGLTELTVAVRVRRRGGPAFQRIFDFGTGTGGEDPAASATTVGRSYVAATSGTGNVPSGLALLASIDGAGGEVALPSAVALDAQLRLVVVTYTAATVSLFHEGVLLGTATSPGPLSAVVDVNDWLGRSQYSADAYFEGDLADVRLFDRALAPCAVAALQAAGDAPP